MKTGLQFLIFFIFFCSLAYTQTIQDVAVQVTASCQTNPAQITLSWNGNTTTNQYQVFRKLKSGTSWGGAIASLAGSVTQFVDNSATIGTNYEYRVMRSGQGYIGYGYLNSGIEIETIETRGKVILIIDSTMIQSLSVEIARLISDIEGDGWEVIRHDVLRNGTVTHVKELIINDYTIDSAKIKAVFLLGHVPVPYSGNINPDGHSDHLGAWPADCYYGDVDGQWTDSFLTTTTASPARTQNTPGDGKFDQSVAPSDLELQVGRVDFNDMNAFTLTEQQLLKNYLDKDHAYRKKIISPMKRAVIDDNFGYFSGEAFAASGLKNFSALVGSANTTYTDYVTAMTAGSYQWSFGCGGGSYTSASGIGTTSGLATASLQGIFTMLFGSYFGDWDAPNSFLKAPLAQGQVLTNVWSGRPHFQFHHMGLGENIGYGLLITQNNPGGLYFASPTGITGKWIHNALMGDPTLRNDVVAPVSNVIATKSGYDCIVSWSASTETAIVGYNIYMKNDTNSTFQKINQSPISGTTYTDNCLLYQGIYTYMVKALKLEITPSGTYYNTSEGISDTAYNSSNIKTYAAFSSTIAGSEVFVSDNSINATAVNWNFGNGQTISNQNGVASYTANGTYTIVLTSTNGCASDTATLVFNLLDVGLSKNANITIAEFYPNPATDILYFKGIQEGRVQLFNISGALMLDQKVTPNGYVNLKDFSSGIYLLKFNSDNRQSCGKLVIE